MKVYPTKPSALNVVHPNGVKLTIEGVDWPDDGFAFRMLRQGIATKDRGQAMAADPKDTSAE